MNEDSSEFAELSSDTLEYLKRAVPGNVGIYLIDEHGAETLYQAESVAEILSLSDDEHRGLTGGDAYDHALPQDRPSLIEAVKKCVTTGEPLDFQYRVTHGNRNFEWAHVRGKVCGTIDGAPVLLCNFTNSSVETNNYRDILEHSDNTVYVCDRDTYEILYANENAMGYRENDEMAIVGHTCYEYIRGLNHPCSDCYMGRTEEGETLTDERFNEVSGRWEHVSGKFIEWCGHDAFLQYIRDITDRKHEEARYHRTMEDLLAANPQALCAFQVNITRNICLEGRGTSDYVQAMLASDTADGLFANLLGLIDDAEDRRRCAGLLNRVTLLAEFADGHDQLSIDYRRRAENGQTIWVTSFVSIARNPSTGDVEASVYSENIDEHKKDELVVAHLMEEKCDCIALLYPAEHELEYRSSKKSIRDVPLRRRLCYEEELQVFVTELVVSERREALSRSISLDRLQEELGCRDDYSVTCETFSEDGKSAYKQLHFSWLGGSHRAIVMVQNDITDVFVAEQEQSRKLREALDEAEQAREAEAQFLSRMSHDIRTPMNGIIGMTHIAQGYDNPAETVDCLKKIATSSHFLLGLVNDVLDMSRIESGEIRLHPEPYPQCEFVDYLEAVVRPLCEEKSHTLIITEHVDSDCVPMLDKLRINQIVFNLLSNAIKYTPEGGTITCDISEHVLGDTMGLVFAVTDNGIGIEEDFQKHLFEPFTQENRYYGTATRENSTGLGLPIVKQLVSLMGGTLEVRSVKGEGSTFAVHLKAPCKRASELAVETPSGKADVREGASLAGKHILLIEDHPLNAEIASAILEEAEAVVTVAENGKRGFDAFRVSPEGFYDLVLMDIRMPVMDGYESTQAIRALGREDATRVPIIAMSADAFADDVAKCLAAGMNAHIPKPIDPDALFRELANWVG